MDIIIAAQSNNLDQTEEEVVGKLINDKTKVNFKNLYVMNERNRLTKEQAVFEGKADCAIYQMRKYPINNNKKFKIVAIPVREEKRLGFISNKGYRFEELTKGSTIGTTNIRTSNLIKAINPEIEVILLGENLQTNLEKMIVLNLDGIIVESAQIIRVGLKTIINEYLDPYKYIPGVGEGALGVQCLEGNPANEYIEMINNKKSYNEVLAERSFLKALKIGTSNLVGIYSESDNEYLRVLGYYIKENKLIKQELEGKLDDAETIGKNLAFNLVANL